MDDKDIEEIKRLVEQKPPVRNRPPIPKAEQLRRKAEREKLRRRRQIIMNTAAVVIIALFSRSEQNNNDEDGIYKSLRPKMPQGNLPCGIFLLICTFLKSARIAYTKSKEF